VLWETLTGRRLFRRDTELATMRAIVDDPIPRPSDLGPVPPELDAIAMRALRKRRDGRFQSATEMSAALERYAFSHSGFSPSEVGRYMKTLFASESLQWRKTATAALDMEVERPSDENHPSVAVLTTEPATMALRPSGVTWEVRPGSDARSHGALSPTRLDEERSRASGASAAPGSARGDRLWVYGGLTVLLAVAGAAALVLARPPWLFDAAHRPAAAVTPEAAGPPPGITAEPIGPTVESLASAGSGDSKPPPASAPAGAVPGAVPAGATSVTASTAALLPAAPDNAAQPVPAGPIAASAPIPAKAQLIPASRSNKDKARLRARSRRGTPAKTVESGNNEAKPEAPPPAPAPAPAPAPRRIDPFAD
jgi:serine/threonine-protein kinase